MTKKRKLSDLVATETQRKEPPAQPTEPESDIEPQPKYLTLVRKETRLKELQIEQLTAISRKLNRQRRGRGERLTENTLIRVAIELLLSQADSLSGTTEAELLESLGLELTE
jgi:hypothetical protein